METSDAKLAEEVHKLNECFEQLKSDLASMERQNSANVQYPRS